MSEIKGQLLGIILVIMIFGAVAGALTSVFNGLSGTVTSEVAQIQSDYVYE